MKNVRQILSIALLSLATISTYGCMPKKEKQSINPLIAHAITPKKKEANNTVKIALLLDTSNSMDGLINQSSQSPIMGYRKQIHPCQMWQ